MSLGRYDRHDGVGDRGAVAADDHATKPPLLRSGLPGAGQKQKLREDDAWEVRGTNDEPQIPLLEVPEGRLQRYVPDPPDASQIFVAAAIAIISDRPSSVMRHASSVLGGSARPCREEADVGRIADFL